MMRSDDHRRTKNRLKEIEISPNLVDICPAKVELLVARL
jgi:hypothetical protein